MIHRYATRDVRLGGAPIQRGELVTISIAGANRDPDVFPDPDGFDVRRETAAPRGLVFRKPPELHVLWGPPTSR